jgi:hypothetical protein
MIRFVPALAMAALSIATAFAPVRAEVAAQPEPAASKTKFRASPITPGFWQFSNIKNVSSNDIAQGCWDYVTFQFQDGYLAKIVNAKRAESGEGAAEPGENSFAKHEKK